MLFWALAIPIVLLVAALMLAPILRGGAPVQARAVYDMQVYRDQLREIETDLARGVLTNEEAEATRAEISRKLLAAADAAERTERSRPVARGQSLALAGVAGVAVVAAGIGTYAWLGQPAMPDRPLALRLAELAEARANRPGQAEVEAMIASAPGTAPPEMSAEDAALIGQLQAILETRPDDLRGHRLMADSMAALGRWSEARVAQERVVQILGAEATAADRIGLAELMIFAANGYVSPEAEEALATGLALDPNHPQGRYYSGLTLLQGGRPDLAYNVWARLLQEGPPDAPWVQAIAAEIDDVAAAAGLPAPGQPVPGAGGTLTAQPGAEGMEAPEELLGTGIAGGLPTGMAIEVVTDEATRAMIDDMVSGLASRLAEEGGPAADWAMLIRSLGALGEIARAGAVWQEAQETFAGDQQALVILREAARDARLVN